MDELKKEVDMVSWPEKVSPLFYSQPQIKLRPPCWSLLMVWKVADGQRGGWGNGSLPSVTSPRADVWMIPAVFE